MASLYPGDYDNFSTAHQDGVQEVIHAATDNDEADAINKIEAELGLLPKGVYADVTTRLNTLESLNFNPQSGSAYTLALSDATGCVVMTSASANTITIPPAASVNFLDGTEIRIRQGGAGQTTISPGSGVTLVNPFLSYTMAAQNAEAKLLKIGTNAWSLNGEVT